MARDAIFYCLVAIFALRSWDIVVMMLPAPHLWLLVHGDSDDMPIRGISELGMRCPKTLQHLL